MAYSFIITCEHAGNSIPEPFKHLFQGNEDVLMTHRGWDIGAIGAAEFLAERLGAPLFLCEESRLLIETNRSLNSNQLFSEFSQNLNALDKDHLLNEIYHPYRNTVIETLEEIEKPVVHLSIHSFTPVLNGVERKVDIGLLFDPARPLEKSICETWANRLISVLPQKSIMLNEPYKGTDDGFTTFLRTQFSESEYAGIEIELNQKFAGTVELQSLLHALIKTLPV